MVCNNIVSLLYSNWSWRRADHATTSRIRVQDTDGAGLGRTTRPDVHAHWITRTDSTCEVSIPCSVLRLMYVVFVL